MGNNPSANARSPNSASPSLSSHDSSSSSSKPTSTRRDPRNLIHAQRAPAEASLAQARGTTTSAAPAVSATHRARNSQSQSQSNPQSSTPAAQLRYPSPSQSLNSPSHKSSDSQMGAQPSKEPKVDMREEQRSKPVDVPAPNSNIDTSSIRSYSLSIDPSGPPLTQDMSYHLTRPPRLPLPIEEEVHTPGSPIIAPADVNAPLEEIESLDNDVLPRRSSALSNTTMDEEDAEELAVDKTGATVPTTFEWRKPGADKVYVTGTIFQWNRKHRLHRGSDGILRTVANVRPGTHHVRFIVDGLMLVSEDLPTTVDFGNNLVNYIEVSADDLPRNTPEIKVVKDGAPVISAEGQAQTSKPAEPPKQQDEGSETTKTAPKTKPVLPHGRYTSEVPQYLLDLDKAEDSAAYRYAAAAIEKLPSPPSLPGFLGKPILNAATPMKDDNSVLTMPNHTVLNHLATSSIKNNVLAVSVTTRYRKKYVTTIMYKPTGDD